MEDSVSEATKRKTLDRGREENGLARSGTKHSVSDQSNKQSLIKETYPTLNSEKVWSNIEKSNSNPGKRKAQAWPGLFLFKGLAS